MSLEYKGYSIESNMFSNKVIKPIGKGSVSSQLRGLYTNATEAMRAIDAHPKKGVTKNVSTKDSDRGN